MYANQQDQGEGDDDAGSDAHDADKDDVIDAEFREVGDDDKKKRA
jgi:molecular chaperone DnaK